MPPKKPRLTDATIADFENWVNAGAPYSSSGDPRPSAASPLEQAREHWAFRPVKKAVPPTVADAAWVTNPIDAFVVAKLESRRWHPAPPAGRDEWLRRVTFDVTGLPPTPEEIAAFENDHSPLAEERVVDRLLDSPRYGERLAQHWLDVVRYAETEGFEYDRHIPDAWRFRDYVIDSLNHDKPFDRFVVEQIAGDEIAPGDRECQAASIFHRIGPVRRNAGNPEIALSRNEVLTERHRHHRHGVPGVDRGLRPVPQPQARADQSEGLLPARGLLRGHRGARHQPGHRGPARRPGSRRARGSRARSRSSRRRYARPPVPRRRG